MNQQHKVFAIACFNEAWELMDKKDRTIQESMNMIHLAHASRYHWGVIGTPLNVARGDWQISRVYALLDQKDHALRYATSSLNLCLEHGIGGFDLAFGYEAVARSYGILGDEKNMIMFKEKAIETAMTIEYKGDRQYVLGEIDTIKLNEITQG